MKKHDFGKPLCRSIMAVAIMMLSLQAMAYDFSYTHQGKTLYYDIISDSTVEVTYYNNIDYVSGDVVIPSTVTYNGTTYSVTSIGDYAFEGCSGLTSVTIPNSVTSIGVGAFWGCGGLTTLNFNAINCQDFSSYYSDNPFDGTSLTTVNIGDSVQRIPANFVRGCSGLTSVTIPNSVTSIGNSAFYGCISLTSVSIPSNITSIENGAFAYCSGLTSVTIPNSVTSIGWQAFYACSSLTSITLPNSVTSIGVGAFWGCSGLTTLNFNAINCQYFEAYYDNGHYYYPFSGTLLTTVNIGDSVQRIPANFVGNCSGLTSVTIPNSVTSIGDGAFAYCSGLTSVTIPNSVTSIGGRAFSSCSGLTSVTIPNSVTSIGGRAFSGCSSLTSVTIGNSLTSIGDRAFYECLNLSSLISLATVPPTIGNEAFPYPNICTVTVPCGSLEAYTASTCYWSVYFPQRITESSSFELSVSANEEAYGRVEVETQSCNVKTLTAIANEGYEFTAWNDGNTENPRTVTITSDTAFMAIFAEAVSTPR